MFIIEVQVEILSLGTSKVVEFNFCVLFIVHTLYDMKSAKTTLNEIKSYNMY